MPYPWLAGAPPPPYIHTPILGRLSKEEVIAYWGMRQEFLRDRSLLPPHADSRNRLPATFDYARYLMLSLSEDLVEMVDVDWPTWVVLEALAVAWCGVVAVNDGPFLLAAGWVAFEYAIFALALAFLNHVRRIARGTMDPAARDYIGGADTRGEFTPIVGQDLPGWACAVDARIEEAERHHVRRLFCGHAPNKQHRLFLFEEKGHESHVFACRLLLLLQAVYVSLVVMTFAAARVQALVGAGDGRLRPLRARADGRHRARRARGRAAGHPLRLGGHVSQPETGRPGPPGDEGLARREAPEDALRPPGADRDRAGRAGRPRAGAVAARLGHGSE